MSTERDSIIKVGEWFMPKGLLLGLPSDLCADDFLLGHLNYAQYSINLSLADNSIALLSDWRLETSTIFTWDWLGSDDCPSNKSGKFNNDKYFKKCCPKYCAKYPLSNNL